MLPYIAAPWILWVRDHDDESMDFGMSMNVFFSDTAANSIGYRMMFCDFLDRYIIDSVAKSVSLVMFLPQKKCIYI